MANLFQPSLVRATDANGNPVSNAKMYFYSTDSLTAATWYTNQAGTIPGTNPLTANSAGIFKPAFLNPDTTYRIRVTNEDGSEIIWDVDPVRGQDIGAVQTAAQETEANAALAASNANSASISAAAAQSSENDAAASALAASVSESNSAASEALASTAADAAVVASNIYADEATGNAAVTDGTVFAAVGASSNEAVDIWQRVSAGNSTLLRSYPNSTVLGSILSLDTTGSVGQLIAEQGIGRQVAPVTGSAVGNNTYMMADPVTATGAITSIRTFGLNGGGTLKVKRFSLSGTTATQVGSDYDVSIAAGVNELVAGTDFTAIPINEGEYIGMFAYATNGKFAFNSATTADGTGWYQVGGAGNLSTGTLGSLVTASRLEIGFDVGYSAFRSNLPARVAAAEAYATPYKDGATALSEITGAITVFDARDSKDIAAGKVREFKSQDRRLTGLQETLANRPTFETDGPYLDFGTAGAIKAYPQASLRSLHQLPDSTVSPFEKPEGGFVCTGLAMRDDRKWLIVNDGRVTTNAPNWTGSNGPSLFILDEGTLVTRYEFNLRTAVAGGFLGSAQGVDWTNDGTNYFYWVADTAASIVRCLRDNNDGTLTHISGNDITPNAGFTPNGVAIDRTLNEIYMSNATGVGADATNGQRVDVHDITLTAGVAAKTYLRTFQAHDEIDQLCLVYPLTPSADGSTTVYADDPYLFATAGGNGEYPDVHVYTKSGKLVTTYHNVLGPQSTEGIYVDYRNNTFTIAHDGNYHPQGDLDTAVLATYDAELPVAGLCPDRVLVGMLARLKTSISTNFIGFEDSTGGNAGWGLRRSASNTLQIATSERGSSIAATMPATMTDWFYVTLDIQSNGTVTARVNGSSVTVTGSLAGYEYGISAGALVLGGELAATGLPTATGYVDIAAVFIGSLDDIDGNAGAITTRMTDLEAAISANYPDLI